jgi:DNA processing protein
MVRGVGNAIGLALVRAFGGPQAVFQARTDALVCAGVRLPLARAIHHFDGWGEAHAQVVRLRALGGRLVTWLDDGYPELVRQIQDPPLFLFVLGEVRSRDALAVAVVGTRTPSPYGRRMAQSISRTLAERGVTIVSGLARGIDAEAHSAALAVGGRTIAVLGCGIDVVYPSEHHRLHMQIARNGAVVSELPLGTSPDAENFPVRNRIISGMSLGTVVVEAKERSGSLITAQCAADQGRDVFAVPGAIGPLSRGPHRLIKQGAALVEDAIDVLDEVAPHLAIASAPRISAPNVVQPGTDAVGVLAAVGSEPTHVDEIAARSRLKPEVALRCLLELELAGTVLQLPGKYFIRVHPAGDPSAL